MRSAETESHYCNGSNGVDNPFTYIRIHIHMIRTYVASVVDVTVLSHGDILIVRCHNE